MDECEPLGGGNTSRTSSYTATNAANTETSALLAAGLDPGSTTSVAPFVGEALQWGGAPFERPPALVAAAALDTW